MKNLSKPKISVSAFLSMIIVFVLLAELAGAYFIWWRNIQTVTVETAYDNIVRVDLPGYRSVIQKLDDFLTYQPQDSASQYGNPFIYR
jgi:hypothetical protein